MLEGTGKILFPKKTWEHLPEGGGTLSKGQVQVGVEESSSKHLGHHLSFVEKGLGWGQMLPGVRCRGPLVKRRN